MVSLAAWKNSVPRIEDVATLAGYDFLYCSNDIYVALMFSATTFSTEEWTSNLVSTRLKPGRSVEKKAKDFRRL
jgi:hypothetical protein